MERPWGVRFPQHGRSDDVPAGAWHIHGKPRLAGRAHGPYRRGLRSDSVRCLRRDSPGPAARDHQRPHYLPAEQEASRAWLYPLSAAAGGGADRAAGAREWRAPAWRDQVLRLWCAERGLSASFFRRLGVAGAPGQPLGLGHRLRSPRRRHRAATVGARRARGDQALCGVAERGLPHLSRAGDRQRRLRSRNAGAAWPANRADRARRALAAGG